jgi:peroxiredoxin Q/BCP
LQAKYKIAKIMLVIGDKMPTFSVVDQHGNTVTDQMLLGQKTIIYFYPKDSTPGCTAEACNLRDNYVRLQAEGYQVVGVSKDSVKSHVNFIAKNNLPFTLLSDPSTEMLQAFGAWGEKKMCGKTCVGTLRKTFVFDEQGVLTQVIEKVDTKNHAEQILV